MKSIRRLSINESRARLPMPLARSIAGLVLSLCAATAIGCAGAPIASKVAPREVEPVVSSVPTAEPESASPTLAPLSSEARSIAFSFTSTKGDATAAQTSDAIHATLVRAGYWVVDGSAPSDARIEIRVKHAQKASSPLLGVQVAPADPSNVEVSLAVMDQQVRVEWLVARLDAHDETSKGIDDLVDRLSTSPRFAAFAKSAAAKKAVQGITPGLVASHPSLTTSSESAASRDEAQWSESAVRRCRNGRRVDACSKIREYLEKFPEGAHAANAKAALELSAHNGAR